MTGPHAWDRRPGESSPAHQALLSYCRLGPARSLDAVGREWGESVSLLARWSARWGWVERAAAYDAHAAEVDLRARDAERARMAAEWERRADQDREANWQRGQAIRAQLDIILDRWKASSQADPPAFPDILDIKRAVEAFLVASRLTEAAIMPRYLSAGAGAADLPMAEDPEGIDVETIDPRVAEAAIRAALDAAEHFGIDPRHSPRAPAARTG